MKTFQDFQQIPYGDTSGFIDLINYYKCSKKYQIAIDANLYDRQQNSFIMTYPAKMKQALDQYISISTESVNTIPSNFFNHLNTQLVSYVLGKGIEFTNPSTRKKLSDDFEHVMYNATYYAKIHGVSFLFWNNGEVVNFDATEFCPFYDEMTGELRAGIRFWQLASDKPLMFTVYEEDGYTSYMQSDDFLGIVQDKQTYKLKIYQTQNGEILNSEGENYKGFPIVPIYANKLKQSSLIGIKNSIDSYDLIKSGFATDLADVAQVYWLINGADGMTNEEINAFIKRLLLNHVGLVNTDAGTSITPYTQEVPYQSRLTYLENLEKSIYKDFGALDPTSLTGGNKTTVEIRAAYEPLNANADELEYGVAEAIRRLFALGDIDDKPVFKRSMIVNEKEQIETLLLESDYLDTETLLRKLPNIDTEEIESILAKKKEEDVNKYRKLQEELNEEETTEEEK